MTMSRDGFIASTSDETPWGDDSWEAFREFVRSCDVILLGRRTFVIMKSGNEFVDGPEYIVVTTKDSLDTDGLKKLNIQKSDDIPKAAKIGIIGGGVLNGRLAELGVIDEVIIDTEPINLGTGIKLFGSHNINPKLELLNTRALGKSTIQRHFKLVR